MRRTFYLLALALLAFGSLQADDKANGFLTEDLSGWEGLIKEYWSYKDGALVGYAPTDPGYNTFLCSKKTYKDSELTFKVRLKDGGGNSGVQVRSEIFDREKFAVKGPQCDIGAGYWGSLYGELFGGMMKQSPKDRMEKVLKKDDFNDYHIRCVGKKVTIRLNGETMVDEEFAEMPESGIIAFQLHAGGPMEVTFKNIQFKDLRKKE